eukprot:1416149-Rhodomonas_salina.1
MGPTRLQPTPPRKLSRTAGMFNGFRWGVETKRLPRTNKTAKNQGFDPKFDLGSLVVELLLQLPFLMLLLRRFCGIKRKHTRGWYKQYGVAR